MNDGRADRYAPQTAVSIHEGNAASVRTAMKAGFCPAGNSTDPETGRRQDVYELK